MKDDINSTFKPPYVTFRTFLNFIESLKNNDLPPVIDRSLMRNLSGSMQSPLISSLKALKLLDENQVPTEQFRFLHSTEKTSSEYCECLRSIIYSCYTFLNDGSIDVERATGSQLEQKFRESGLSGDTVQRAYSFFVSICKEAEFTISRHIIDHRFSSIRKKVSKKKQAKNDKTGISKNEQESIPAGTLRFEIPIVGKATASIALPKNMNKTEWELIKTVIDAQGNHIISVGSEDMKHID